MIHAWVCLLNVMTFIMCSSSCVYKRNLCFYVYLSPSFSLGVNRLLFLLSHFLISMFSNSRYISYFRRIIVSMVTMLPIGHTSKK